MWFVSFLKRTKSLVLQFLKFPFSLRRPHSGTSSSIFDSPLPSRITSSSFDLPFCSSITPSLFQSDLKPIYFTNPTLW